LYHNGLCKVLIVGIYFTFILFPSHVMSAEVSARQDISITSYSVSGNKDQSFYPEDKLRYLYQGSISFREQLKEDEGSFYGDIFYRSTDDALVDVKDMSLEQFTIGYKDKQKDFVLGDYFARFSDYSVNNALKGAKFEYIFDETTQVTMLAGVDTTTWEILWDERKGDGPTKRHVFGNRFQKIFSPEKPVTVGMNYAFAEDDHAYFTEFDTSKKIHVISTDIRYQIYDTLALFGDVAQSYRAASTGSGIVYDDKWDQAYKVGIDLVMRQYISFLQYSRVGPHFETTSNLNTQDLETFLWNSTLIPSEGVLVSPYISITRDNLQGLKDTTTRYANEGINLSWQAIDLLTLNARFDNRKEDTNDQSTNNRTTTYGIGGMLGTNAFSTILDYARIARRDNVDSAQVKDRDDISVSVNMNHTIRSTNISWTLGETFSHERNVKIEGKDIIFIHFASINISFPSDFMIRASARFSDNDYHANENDSVTNQYEFSLSKRIDDALTASVDCVYNNNDFTDQNNDYNEKKVTAKLTYIF